MYIYIYIYIYIIALVPCLLNSNICASQAKTIGIKRSYAFKLFISYQSFEDRELFFSI